MSIQKLFRKERLHRKRILAVNFVFERKGTGNRNSCSLQSSKLWTPWQLIIPSSFLAQSCICSVFVVTTVCFRMNLPCFQLSSDIFWTVYTVTVWHCPHSAEPHRDWSCGLYWIPDCPSQLVTWLIKIVKVIDCVGNALPSLLEVSVKWNNLRIRWKPSKAYGIQLIIVFSWKAGGRGGGVERWYFDWLS